MYTRNLKITDASGVSKSVEYVFADDGKVLIDKDGNDYMCVESLYANNYTEVDYAEPEESTAEDKAEAYDILMGVSE